MTPHMCQARCGRHANRGGFCASCWDQIPAARRHAIWVAMREMSNHRRGGVDHYFRAVGEARRSVAQRLRAGVQR